MILDIVVAALVIFATFMVVATAVVQWRAPDPLTRANLMGPTVGVAFPVLLVAKWLHDLGADGFNLGDTIRMLIAIAGVWIVASVGSFYMGRAIYGVTVSDWDRSH